MIKNNENDNKYESRNKYKESLQFIQESLNIGKMTIQNLSEQSETLNRSETQLEECHYNTQLANRIVRGMTWTGWLQNKLISHPQLNINDKKKEKVEIQIGFICPECKISFEKSETLMNHYYEKHENIIKTIDHSMDKIIPAKETSEKKISTTSYVDNDLTNEQKGFIHSAESQLEELKHVSLALGNILDSQNVQMGRIQEKAENTDHLMRQVTYKQTKIINNNDTNTNSLVYKFTFSFQYENTKKFIKNRNDEPFVGSLVADKKCLFQAFSLKSNPDIWGFKSVSNGNFFGINRYGTIKIQGKNLKSYEEFSFSPNKEFTAIFCFAGYFGNGAWICVDSITNKLYCIRGTNENRKLAAKFRIVRSD